MQESIKGVASMCAAETPGWAPWVVHVRTTYIVDDVHNAILIEDDILPVTCFCTALECVNNPLLSRMVADISFEYSHPAAVLGKIIHEIIQVCIMEKSSNLQFIVATARRLLSAHERELYSSNTSDKALLNDLLKCVRHIVQFLEAKLDISTAEQGVLSRDLGLRGYIDCYGPGLIVEIKTGKAPQVSHRAQLLLYTLLILEGEDLLDAGGRHRIVHVKLREQLSSDRVVYACADRCDLFYRYMRWSLIYLAYPKYFQSCNPGALRGVRLPNEGSPVALPARPDFPGADETASDSCSFDSNAVLDESDAGHASPSPCPKAAVGSSCDERGASSGAESSDSASSPDIFGSAGSSTGLSNMEFSDSSGNQPGEDAPLTGLSLNGEDSACADDSIDSIFSLPAGGLSDDGIERSNMEAADTAGRMSGWKAGGAQPDAVRPRPELPSLENSAVESPLHTPSRRTVPGFGRRFLMCTRKNSAASTTDRGGR